MRPVEDMVELTRFWLDGYITSLYDYGDRETMAGLLHKKLHTLKVAEHCRNLAVYLGLDDYGIGLAELCGLLHDVGRFSQWKEYHSFVDHLTTDHGDEGARLTASIFPYIDDMDGDSREILLNAIRQHNKKDVVLYGDRRDLYLRIVRDCDVLDIYRAVSHKWEPCREGISPAVLEDFLGGRKPDVRKIKTDSDVIIKMISFMYIFSYPWTLDGYRKGRYIYKLRDCLPKSEVLALKKIEAMIKEYKL